MTEAAHREEVLRRALAALTEARARAAAAERAASEPIAIVGIGCRLPGADGPDALWDLLREGRDAIREVPADRWTAADYYDPRPDAPGRTYTNRGGFIDRVGAFDAAFFGIPPREAASMDPQHRLVLEVTWNALEHAGIAPDALRGTRGGVYVGMTTSDYAHVLARTGDPACIDAYLSTGNAPNFAAGRLSYLLGLLGPSLVIDTACSSSLVAIHLACGALRTGECDLALAGGVNLMLLPETTVTLAKARMLSVAGRCATFDASADGYVRGEGCGMIVLKRLSDAHAARDPVVALIRGSALNHDGHGSGITVPNASAQEAVVRQALESARVAPGEIDYIEAHGTGTPLGDPVELRALGRVFAGERDPPALIGSVKTNLGHLEAAAGVAGVIKTALSLERGVIPRHLHFTQPNPHVEWDELPLRVATEPTRLPPHRRIAGVSAFGISGTNAHLVLEGAPTSGRALEPTTPDDREPVLIKLSARGEAAVLSSAGRLREFVVDHPDVSLGAVAHAAGAGRADLLDRVAIAADTREELISRLAAVAGDTPAEGTWRGRACPGVRRFDLAATGAGTDDARAAIAQAWVAGAQVDWARLHPRIAPVPRLPTYRFASERHWVDPVSPGAGAPASAPTGLSLQAMAIPMPQDVYRTVLSLRHPPLIAEHRVFGHAVTPGVVYLELVLRAAERSGHVAPVVDQLQLLAPLLLADDDRVEVQVVVEPAGQNGRRVHVHSAGTSGWRRHAEAIVRDRCMTPDADPSALDAVRARCRQTLSGDRFYAEVWHPQFALGPSFRLIESIRRRDREALAVLRLPPDGDSDDAPRPELLALDACVQALAAARPAAEGSSGEQRPLSLGTGHSGFTEHAALTGAKIICWATVTESHAGETRGDIAVFDAEGRAVSRVSGITFRRIEAESLRQFAVQADGGPRTPRRADADVRRRLTAAVPEERAGVVAEYLAAELAIVLGAPRDDIDLELPLTSLADSLMLAELKSRAETDLDVEIPFEALFDQPYVADLARWIEARVDGRLTMDAGEGIMPVARLRQAAADRAPAGGPLRHGAVHHPPTAILLTGATGFLGAFLLAELTAQTDARIHCLVRADSAEAAGDRLRLAADRYGLAPPAFGDRVVVEIGDLSRRSFGLNEARFAALAESVDAVYHCGAIVNWTFPYAALEAVNVGGTCEILRLAQIGRVLPVHAVSTVGVFSSPALAGRIVSEADELESSGPLAVGYAQSKWVAEWLVRDAGRRGMPVTIHRPSIGPDSRTGAFNAADHVVLMIRGCLALGAAPDSELPVQIAPVDFVSRALVHLSLRPDCAGGTFHLVNGTAVTFNDLFDGLADIGHAMPRLPEDEWLAHLRAELTAGRTNPLAGLMPFLDSALARASLPVFDSARTAEALRPSGITCPPLDAQMLRRFLEELVATDTRPARRMEKLTR